MVATDEELLERWVSRHDAEAFKDLTARYANMVFSTCRRILGNEADAEDIAQECFVTLAGQSVTPATYLGPWLHRVATNRSLNWIRKETRRKKREATQHDPVESVAAESDKEVLALVDEAIANLPEKQRIPVVAYFFENQTHETIAQNLDLTRQGAAYRIQSGINSIRKTLKHQGVTAGASTLSVLLAEEASAASPATLAAQLGKIALRGPVTASNGAIAAKPITALIMLKSKAIMATGLLMFAILVGGLFYLNKTPPTSPGPNPIPLQNDASDNRESTPLESTQRSANQPIDDTTQQATVLVGRSFNNTGVAPTANTGETTEEKEPHAPGTVTGFVNDEQAFPIAGATVALFTSNPGSSGFRQGAATTTTDSSGVFQFESVDAKIIYLSASAKGRKTVSKQVEVKSDQSKEMIGLVLSRGTLISGIVLTQEREPVANAVVSSIGAANTEGSGSGGWMHQNAITDVDGAFAIGFGGEGIVTIKVVSPHNGERIFIGLPIGQEEPIELVLAATPSLSGTVTRKDGSPASDIGVILRGSFSMPFTGSSGDPGTVDAGSDRRSAMTNHAGVFSFPNLVSDSRYKVHLESEGKLLSLKNDLGVFLPGEKHVWDHELAPMIRVYGTVTGEHTGKPIKNIRISYFNDGEFTEGPYLNRDNNYDLRLFEPGTYYIFPEYNHTSREMTVDTYGIEVTVNDGDERELNLKLPDPFTLSIKVTDETGKPIQGADVNWHRTTPMGNSSFGSGTTDEEGCHSNDFFPGLESHFYIKAEGYAPTRSDIIAGLSDETYPEETIVVYKTGGVEGTVVNSHGTPVSNAQLQIAQRAEGVLVQYKMFSDSDFLSTTTDQYGAFAIGDGFPAVLGDLHIKIRMEDDRWVDLTTIENLEIPARYVTDIGTVTFIPPPVEPDNRSEL
jgi:RNA polymerase sigma-70 factor (ECF subfamily)